MVGWAILSVLTLQTSTVAVETLEPGIGAIVASASTVEIDFTVRDDKGKALLSTLDRGLTLWVNLANPKSLPLWRKGLVGLKVGGRRKVTASPYWYGGDVKGARLEVFVTVRAVK